MGERVTSIKGLALSSFIYFSAALLQGHSWANNPILPLPSETIVESTLDELLHSPLLATLAGIKPFSFEEISVSGYNHHTDQWYDNSRDIDAKLESLEAAFKNGKLRNPNIGWFTYSSNKDRSSKFKRVIFYNRAAIQQTLRDPEKMKVLSKIGFSEHDSVETVAERIRTMLANWDPSILFIWKRDVALGIWLGFPLLDVISFPGNSGFNEMYEPQSFYRDAEFLLGSFVQLNKKTTQEIQELQKRSSAAVERYKAERKSGKKAIDIFNHWDSVLDEWDQCFALLTSKPNIIQRLRQKFGQRARPIAKSSE